MGSFSNLMLFTLFESADLPVTVDFPPVPFSDKLKTPRLLTLYCRDLIFFPPLSNVRVERLGVVGMLGCCSTGTSVGEY
jgi:hypothetical protein